LEWTRFPRQWLLAPQWSQMARVRLGRRQECQLARRRDASFIQVRRGADSTPVRDWLYPHICGAGRGAQDRYDVAAGRWRRRVFRRLRIAFGALVLLLIALEAANRHGLTAWILGLALGAAIAGIHRDPRLAAGAHRAVAHGRRRGAAHRARSGSASPARMRAFP
jgi:hypothetical protein